MKCRRNPAPTEVVEGIKRLALLEASWCLLPFARQILKDRNTRNSFGERLTHGALSSGLSKAQTDGAHQRLPVMSKLVFLALGWLQKPVLCGHWDRTMLEVGLHNDKALFERLQCLNKPSGSWRRLTSCFSAQNGCQFAARASKPQEHNSTWPQTTHSHLHKPDKST